jgi:hypothetical protein
MPLMQDAAAVTDILQLRLLLVRPTTQPTRQHRPDEGPRDEAGRPLIRKLGTIDLDLVETTPVVFHGRLWRFEWVRWSEGTSRYWDNQRRTNHFRFRDPATGEVTAPFADGHEFGSAFVEGETVYVTGTQGRSRIRATKCAWSVPATW